MGKGDKRRPCAVSQAEWARRYEAAFKAGSAPSDRSITAERAPETAREHDGEGAS